MVNPLVLPAVAKIALVGENAHDSAFINQGEKLRCFAIMLMGFGQAVGKRIRLLENIMGERQFHEIQLGKHLFHLWFDVLTDAIVVIDVKEATGQHVVAEVLGLSGIKDHVAVPRHVYVRIVEDVGAGRLHGRHLWIDDDVKDCLCDLYNKGENALILIGPEGDFSPEEVALAKENGFVPCSLGDARLRTETAALVACHTVQIINQMK